MKRLLIAILLTGSSLYASYSHECILPVDTFCEYMFRMAHVIGKECGKNLVDLLAERALKPETAVMAKSALDDLAAAGNVFAQEALTTLGNNPRVAVAVLGASAVSCFIYKSISCISSVDHNKAGTVALMGYGVLHMLADVKRTLKQSIWAAEQEESRGRSELKMEDFEHIAPYSASSSSSSYSFCSIPDSYCPDQNQKIKSLIFLQLQENRLRANIVFLNYKNN